MKKRLINSPNYNNKFRTFKDIQFVIIHYTGMQSEIESIKRLKNPKSSVSCHYLIGRKGQITQMIDEKKIAWHAGKSKWKNFSNLNKNSVGIELQNKGHNLGYEKFPNSQINSLIKLSKSLKKRYKIKKENFLGHSDIAPLRKKDPGEKFPWKKLSKLGIGKWYKIKKLNFNYSKKKSEKLFFKNLRQIGYRYFKILERSKNDKLVIRAFQRKYNPKNVSGIIDPQTLKISHFLLG